MGGGILLKTFLYRLRNPKVITGIVSQVVTISMLLSNPDVTAFSGVAAAVCSILSMLGIISDPDEKGLKVKNKYMTCTSCGKFSCHIDAGGKKICKECGNELSPVTKMTEEKIEYEKNVNISIEEKIEEKLNEKIDDKINQKIDDIIDNINL